MTGLDTSVLVRYLTQDDPVQARKANALIEREIGRGRKLHLDVVVLCELAWVLRGAYRHDRETIVRVLETILHAAHFSVDDRDLLREAVAAYGSGRGDFADCVVGLRNRKAGCETTRTFDRALRKNDAFQAA